MNKTFFTIAIVGILLLARAQAGELQVGFAQLSITPDIIDQWVDVNDDAQFDPDIDLWTDVNGNGKFDAVWMAGFQNQRPAHRSRRQRQSYGSGRSYRRWQKSYWNCKC